MDDPTTSIYVRNARRQIRHAITTGKEHDLYGAIYQLIGHSCHLATIKDHRRVAFYCDPQGILTFNLEVSRSELEGFNDPDYAPPLSSISKNLRRSEEAVAEERGVAAEEGEGTTEEDEDEGVEDEAGEEESRSGLASEVEGPRLRSKHAPTAVDPMASSAGATSSSASTMFNRNITRYPDYRLVKAYLDELDNERVRYNLALVEVKIFAPPEDDRESWREGRKDINSIAENMLPQVIQAVQVIFAKHESYEEVVAIPVVNEYCKFMYFRRSEVPAFNTTSFDPRGYQEPDGLQGKELAKKLERYAYKISGRMIKIVYGVHEDGGRLGFGLPFLRHWSEFLAWTESEDMFGNVLFPEQPESL